MDHEAELKDNRKSLRSMLLLEDESIMRHAIANSPLLGKFEITAFPCHTTLDKMIDESPAGWMHGFDVAILDPGVPPIPPPSVQGAAERRIELVSKLISMLRPDCVTVVMTGAYSTVEGDRMMASGATHYVSKAGIDMIQLRHYINNDLIALSALTGRETGPETSYSDFPEGERIALAVEQGILPLDDTAEALGVEQESIRKNLTRGRKRKKSYMLW